MKDNLQILIKRLVKIGVNIEIVSNVPWVYLYSINGKKVTEKTEDSNHGFNIAWIPINPNKELYLTNTKELFQLIRKYLKS
jgi:hypothetical protein